MPRRTRPHRESPAIDAVHVGDNLSHMRALPDGCCDLIYLDPPFSTNLPRRAPQGRRRVNGTPANGEIGQRTTDAAYNDQWPDGMAGYLEFMQPRLAQCHRLLARHGSLYVHLDWRATHHVRLLLDRIFGAANFLNEVIWQYRTGGVATRWFGRKHDTLLVFARCHGKHRFNVLREGRYRTDGLNYDETGRPYKNTRKGRLYFHKDGPVLTDVWDIPFLSTVSTERVAWPTQKPLALLERVIQASSNPGDVVADFFCGSGTTLVAARRLGRRFVGCDIQPRAVAIARRRLRESIGLTAPSPTETKAAPARRPGPPRQPRLSSRYRD